MRMCEILVGLGDMVVLEVDRDDESVLVTVETRPATTACANCGVPATSKGRRSVELVHCAQGFRRFRVKWKKRRWQCTDPDCPMGSWTEEEGRIAAPRMAITDQAGRWPPSRSASTVAA